MNGPDKKNILVLPRHCVFVRFITLPVNRDSEIMSMLRLRAIKEIPFSKDEIVIGFRRLGVDPQGLSSFMVAMSRKDVVNEYLKERKAASLERILLETEVLYLSLVKENLLSTDSADLIISVKSAYIELIIVSSGIIRFSRNLKRDGDIIANIKHALFSYKKGGGRGTPQKAILVYEEDADRNEYTQSLRRNFNIEVAPYKLKDGYPSEAVSMAEINLLPEELSEAKRRRGSRLEGAMLAILLAVAASSAIFYAHYKLLEKERLFSFISEKLDRLDGPVGILKRYAGNLRFLKGKDTRNRVLKEIVGDAFEGVYPGMSILHLSYDGGSDIVYRGISTDPAIVYKFMKFLKRRGYYNNINIEETKKVARGSTAFSAFTIRCRLKEI